VPDQSRRWERRALEETARTQRFEPPEASPSLPSPTSTPRVALPLDHRQLPALGPEFDVPLQAGLDGLGERPSDAALAAMEAHARLLMAWGAAINLTSHRTSAAIALEHIVDSLSALPFLAGSDELLDIGSGAGYPGLPLAWSLPVRRAALVESIGKKARFLEVAVSAGGHELAERGTAVPAIEVLALRAEDVARSPEHRERWAVVIARAVAPMAGLVELALPLLRIGGRLVAWKRDDGSGSLAAELEAASMAIQVAGGEPPVLHSIGVAALDDHVLVEVDKRRTTPEHLPRPPGERRRPLR
jgi:16S rRNA (guanine527-N7)-methyltransferase